MVWNIQVQMKLNPNDPSVEFLSFFLWNPWKNFNIIKFERVDSKEKLGISSWEMKTDVRSKTIEHIKKSFRNRRNPIFETGPLHWSRSKWSSPFFICFNYDFNSKYWKFREALRNPNCKIDPLHGNWWSSSLHDDIYFDQMENSILYYIPMAMFIPKTWPSRLLPSI